MVLAIAQQERLPLHPLSHHHGQKQPCCDTCLEMGPLSPPDPVRSESGGAASGEEGSGLGRRNGFEAGGSSVTVGTASSKQLDELSKLL